MTSPYLSLESVSYVLPDGRTLFCGLTERFDDRRTGMVGRNGAGKTMLARILSGTLAPSAGHCQRSGSVHYLSQQVTTLGHASLAGLAGLDGILDALERIEAGSTSVADFEIVGDSWDIRQRLQQELERGGLGHLAPDTAAHVLSGGEAMRVALMGAVLSDADFLVLDEPSNHLDQQNRKALIEQLRAWPKGLLVISHDRQLLETMERIVELSSLGLRSYGGGYTFYAECKSRERENALQQLRQRKLERKREEQEMREQRERQERRQARDKRHAQDSNQAKILLGRQKERSQNSTGKQRRQHAALREQLDAQVLEAVQQIEDETTISLHHLPVTQTPERVAELQDVELPWVPAATRRIELLIGGRHRIGVVGDNGCGKSTLLKLLSGQLAPLSGSCKVHARTACLDQRLASLAPERSTLEQLLAENRRAGEDELRMRLAHLGLDANRICLPSGELSGGERLKAALACALYADPPAQLLLLDEPGNHLDLPSLAALETMLRDYGGALVVVSHDEYFLDSIRLTHRLSATADGWQLRPW